MKKISKILFCLLCTNLTSEFCSAQTTPIDQVAPGPHILYEARNFVITNSPSGSSSPTTLQFDLYMSASQTYVNYLIANGPSYGFQSGDVAFDLDFGADGTTTYTLPIDRSAVKVSNMISDIQANENLAPGPIPAGYDTRFKFLPIRTMSSDPLTTTPTHVATVTESWPAGTTIRTPTASSGAKLQLRCAASGFGTGLSGSKWGDLMGNSANIVGPSAGLSTPLPVKLVDFSAAREGNTATLSWSTSEESNSDYFDVQRSGDGKAWEKLKTVAAKGESSVEVHYSAVDDSPMGGNNLYRLKMVDKDGTFAFSKIQSVEFDDLKAGYTLFPNPVSDKLNFKSTEDWNSVSSIKIYNTQGVEVYASPLVPVKEIDVKNLPSGTYVVKLSRGSRQSQSYKVVIAR